MPHYIVSLNPGRYFIWGTVTDSALTREMSREDMTQYELRFGGYQVEEDLARIQIERRLSRADEHGTSSQDPQDTADACSRAMTTVGWGQGRMTRHGLIICGDQTRTVTAQDGIYHCCIVGEQIPWIPPPFAAILHSDHEPYLKVGWHWFEAMDPIANRIVHLRLHGDTYRPVDHASHRIDRRIDSSIPPELAGQNQSPT